MIEQVAQSRSRELNGKVGALSVKSVYLILVVSELASTETSELIDALGSRPQPFLCIRSQSHVLSLASRQIPEMFFVSR